MNPAGDLDHGIQIDHLHEALSQFTWRTLKPVLIGLCAMYTILGISHILLLPPAVRGIMATMAGVTAVAMISIRVGLGRVLQPRHAHPIGMGIILLVQLNIMTHLILTRDVLQSTLVILLVIAIGAFLPDPRWHTPAIVITAGSWLMAGIVLFPVDTMIHFLFSIGIAILLSSLIRLGWGASVRRSATGMADLDSLLQRSSGLFQSLFETAHNAVIVVASDGAIEFVNPAARKMLHLPGDRPTIDDLYDPALEDLATEVKLSLQERGFISFEMELLDVEGNPFPAAVVANVVDQNSGLALSLIRDLTEEREAETGRIEFRLAQSRLLMSELLAGIVPGLLAVNPGAQQMALNRIGELVEEAIGARMPPAGDLEEASEQSRNFLIDSGGQVKPRQIDGERTVLEVTSCPWDNEERRQSSLCQVCRLIQEAIVNRVGVPVEADLRATRAEGAETCRFVQIRRPQR